jgi:putative nucleotidyltransferase with HDIG domain
MRRTLGRLRQLNERLASPELRLLAAQLKSVPSIPSLYFKIMEALQSPDCPIEKIGEIVASDPGLTGKMLQLVNSAFFGFSRNVSDAGEAVQLLGVGRIRSLALSILLFSAFDAVKFKAFSVEQIWQHSLRTAQSARQIVQMESDDEVMAEQALSSGLLHDIGKMILADSLPERYMQVIARSKAEKRPLELVEHEVFGADHAELGAYLLQLWGLPVPLVEAVAWHHAPNRDIHPVFGPLTAVHVANSLQSVSKHIGGPPAPILSSYIDKIGCGERLKVWEQAIKRANH